MSRLFTTVLMGVCFLFSSFAIAYPPHHAPIGGQATSVQLNPQTYRVNFKGYNRASRDQVYHNLLVKSAQLAKQKGYRYFTVVTMTVTNSQHSHFGKHYLVGTMVIKLVPNHRHQHHVIDANNVLGRY